MFPRFLISLLLSVPLVAQTGTAGSTSGERLFESETFGGNGRTCRTCHGVLTGTVSPADARTRLLFNPNDPLFAADGSDDGNGHGTARMTSDATIIVRIPMAANVKLAGNSAATFATVFRGVPTTLNTPALDPVLTLDGRQPNLESQALASIHDHAQATVFPTGEELDAIKQFELTKDFFSSTELMLFARGGPAPSLPPGRTPSSVRGRRFFEDVVDFIDLKHGLCAGCHAGPMLNHTNVFSQIAFGIPVATRFQNILVSERNVPQYPVREYVFNEGMPNEQRLSSPDLGRSLVTGVTQLEDDTFSHFNAFKIPTLRGVRYTAPYFHDNSAKTLEDVAAHYAIYFAIVTDPQNGNPPIITLTPQDQADIVEYLKLLD